MALALNCGMGQKDITDLKVGEIDWAGGYIERTRSKTGVKTKHKLWGKTLELLAEFRTVGAAPDDRFFLNENGLPLLRRRVEDGVFKHCDAIKNAIDRLLLKTGLNGGRGLYCLRKTGASLIETIDPAVTEMYLAHAEQGMKKHYAQRDWARLERALVEMEGRLGGVLTE
jgi:integrase